MPARRRILLIQLPIPQPGMEPAEGNVPLAAGYLKLLARLRGMEDSYEIDILPARLANRLSDRGLVAEILARDPWLVGWTCYLWNIDRSLEISRLVKEARPEVRMLIGGPEITADNAWVLERPEVDFAAIGEGEQTFVELLAELQHGDVPQNSVAGLYVSAALDRTRRGVWRDEPVPQGPLPLFRKPLPNLNEVSSPYLHGILDAADEQMLLLETLRGCIFKCKFCYYPKSYDDLYFVSRDKIVANLEHARQRGAREVVLLDPTLNQRRDFDDFLKLLADCNPDRQFRYFGELRAEGINPKLARLLREANFSDVEIGLQSIDPLAQELMDRKNNLKAFERGIHALRDEGIKVKVDLIIGLPGDTRDSIRRSLHYMRDSDLYDEVQVFNLAVLPGTAFRHEALELGLEYQPRPPYYVLKTPTLDLADLYSLMEEAEELFDTEFDPLPAPHVPTGEMERMPSNDSGWRGQSGTSQDMHDSWSNGSSVLAGPSARSSSGGPDGPGSVFPVGATARPTSISPENDARRAAMKSWPAIARARFDPATLGSCDLVENRPRRDRQYGIRAARGRNSGASLHFMAESRGFLPTYRSRSNAGRTTARR